MVADTAIGALLAAATLVAAGMEVEARRRERVLAVVLALPCWPA